MSSTTKRTLGLFLWLGMVGSAIWPIPALDAALGVALAPLRVVSELASPLFVLRRSEVLAAQRGLLSTWDEEAAAGAALLAAQARQATPRDPSLTQGRRLVHAEVVGRTARSADRLLARVRDTRGLVPGLPVVHGGVFVGRIHRVGPASGLDAERIEIELVTSPAARIGARVVDEPTDRAVDLIVGGLDDVGSLAVQSPSDRDLTGGIAMVHTRLQQLDPELRLAEGYRLGRVHRTDREEHWTVACELDYQDGLFHLVVLAPPDDALPSDQPMPQALADRGWRRARPLSHGDPAPWREALRLGVGSAHGASAGSAVAFGARLVGRLGDVAPWSAEAHLFGDVGFHVVAVARFEGDEDVPRVIGRIVSLGRRADGAVVFRATGGEPLPLEPDGPDGCRTAQLFTGAGDAGVPSGLLLGEARVPVAAGDGEDARERHVVLAEDRAGSLRDLWVRVDDAGTVRRERP